MGLSPASTFHGQLTRVKDQDPLEKKLGVVYLLQLQPCIYTHVGETNRALETCKRSTKLPPDGERQRRRQ